MVKSKRNVLIAGGMGFIGVAMVKDFLNQAMLQ